MSNPESPTTPDYKTILLQFIASLTLADHLGDVGNDIGEVLKQIGLEIEWDEPSDLGTALGKMGITTLYGTELGEDEDEDEE